ncbi:phage baseplate assembly protein V [Streptomyces sp. NPDC126514]|uniref:phage baseplate assembly protein V n=1 Tax=Streptomyces sp. NPDC126514 TaxID=3155210 RepID=UPI00332A748F
MFSTLLSQAAETVRPGVMAGPAFPVALPLSPLVADRLVRVTVDTHLHMPDMFELVFLEGDMTNSATEGGLVIGSWVVITGKAAGLPGSSTLIAAEVTSIEALCENMQVYTVVRGLDRSHRLQHARRTRVFTQETDASIAQSIALDAGFFDTDIDLTDTIHTHMPQVNQTDWEFLKQRAREIGFETGVSKGEFYFRKASGSGLSVMEPFGLTFKENLQSFKPSITAANLTPMVEVRSWDAENAEPIVKNEVISDSAATLMGLPAAATAWKSAGFNLPTPPSPPTDPRLAAQLLYMPNPNAFVVNNRPAGDGLKSEKHKAVSAAAEGLAEQIGSTYAEAEGCAIGHPDVHAGRPVLIDGVPAQFSGMWWVTRAQHVFDASGEDPYRTHFWVSGQHDRSLLGLTSMGGSQGKPPRIEGLLCGIVTDTGDVDEITRKPTGRVKVMLPVLSPDYVTDWARVVHVGASADGGAYFMPDVTDEVLVGFELGDVRRPYVIGGLLNSKSGYHVEGLGGPAVEPAVAGQVVRRGFASPTGNRLTFHDWKTVGEGPSLASAVVLGTKSENIALCLDQKQGTVTLACKPVPPDSTSPTGTITIECGDGGTININAGQGGTVNVEGGKEVAVKALKISLTAQTSIEMSAPQSIALKSPSIDLGA